MVQTLLVLEDMGLDDAGLRLDDGLQSVCKRSVFCTSGRTREHTQPLLQLLAIAGPQARLLALLVLTQLAIAGAPPAAGLGSVYLRQKKKDITERWSREHIPHFTFLCLQSSHLGQSVCRSSTGPSEYRE